MSKTTKFYDHGIADAVVTLTREEAALGLIAKWRARAAGCDEIQGQRADIRGRAIRQCADELAALFPASEPQP